MNAIPVPAAANIMTQSSSCLLLPQSVQVSSPCDPMFLGLLLLLAWQAISKYSSAQISAVIRATTL
jgi:hypothetical protein